MRRKYMSAQCASALYRIVINFYTVTIQKSSQLLLARDKRLRGPPAHLHYRLHQMCLYHRHQVWLPTRLIVARKSCVLRCPTSMKIQESLKLRKPRAKVCPQLLLSMLSSSHSSSTTCARRFLQTDTRSQFQRSPR